MNLVYYNGHIAIVKNQSMNQKQCVPCNWAAFRYVWVNTNGFAVCSNLQTKNDLFDNSDG